MTTVTNPKTLSIVRGFHEYIKSPQLAQTCGLGNRFAIIFHPFPDKFEACEFDFELYNHVLTRICEAIRHGEMAIYLDGSPIVGSFEELNRIVAALPADDREPPSRIELRDGGSVVACIETEFWNQFGGPDPYHDSYTASIYTADQRADEFESILNEIAEATKVKIIGRFFGKPRASVQSSWISKIRSAFFHG